MALQEGRMNTKNSISWFELTLVTLMTFTATSGAFSYGMVSLIGLLHTLALICGFIVVRGYLARLHAWFGHVVFVAVMMVLLAEIAIQKIVGLHLNPFILSLLVQPGASMHIGISLPKIILLLVCISMLLGFGSNKFQRPAPTLNYRIALLILLSTSVVAQTGHALQYFLGKADVMSMRRSLPFFYAPHPFYIKALLTPILGDNGPNPFSAPAPSNANIVKTTKTAYPSFTKRKNLLLVVTDSLRSYDIMQNPGLAPNIYKWGNEGWLNLNHYSVSNCTHFSMYSLMTGKLPTRFSSAVAQNQPQGLFPLFEANGYSISSSEAVTLDWYGLPRAILPSSTARTTQNSADIGASDREAINNTIDTLEAADQNTSPIFHMTYLYGNHYPYSGLSKHAAATEHSSILASYQETIKRTDALFGLLMDRLEDEGLLENTLVVFTSDHGDELGENGAIGHASRLNDYQTKVPLLVVGTGKSQPRNVRDHTDILPYIQSYFTGVMAEVTADKPIILANCSYEYPDGFTVLSKEGRFEFSYDDGYLTPLSPQHTGGMAQLSALKLLTSAIAK